MMPLYPHNNRSDRNALSTVFLLDRAPLGLSKGEQIDTVLLAYAALLSDGVALH